MLRVLVVEDDPNKLRNISEAICEVNGCQIENVAHVNDAVSAKRILKAGNVDLLILDLQIPNRIDQAARVDGGVELLRSLQDRPSFFVPSHIIAVTGVAEAYQVAEDRLASLIGVIRYDAASVVWRDQLKSRVRLAIAAERSRARDSADVVRRDLAIITALDEELTAVLRTHSDWTVVSVEGDATRYHEAIFVDDGKELSVVAATAGRMGVAYSASLASKLISRFRPRYICIAGVAGGVRGRVRLGDIVVADPSWDWGSGKFEVVDGSASFAAAPEQIRLNTDVRANLDEAVNDEMLLARVRADVRGQKPANVLEGHVGAVASGAAVIGDSAVVEVVKHQHRQLIGVEMEIYGVMAAADVCSAPRPVAFSAKSITDFADTLKDDSVRSYACQVSAAFIHRFALKYLAQ